MRIAICSDMRQAYQMTIGRTYDASSKASTNWLL
jgi:hypothetical protein